MLETLENSYGPHSGSCCNHLSPMKNATHKFIGMMLYIDALVNILTLVKTTPTHATCKLFITIYLQTNMISASWINSTGSSFICCHIMTTLNYCNSTAHRKFIKCMKTNRNKLNDFNFKSFTALTRSQFSEYGSHLPLLWIQLHQDLHLQVIAIQLCFLKKIFLQ